MNNLMILDSNMEMESVIDVFESLIWTIRFKETGDFELYTPISNDILSRLAVGKYILSDRFFDKQANEAHLMVIETLELDGTHLKVTGRDLKYLLDLRIVWKEIGFDKDSPALTMIQTLLNDAMINPEIPERKIDNFVFDTTSGEWGTLKENTQITCDSLLNHMSTFCTEYKFGYEIVYNFSDKKFHMRLISPVDRTYDQLIVDPVIFSVSFNNLKSSKYIESISTYKNVALVSGEQYSNDDLDLHHKKAIFGDASGLNRREAFIDASSVVHKPEGGEEYYDDPEPGQRSYVAILEDYGSKELKKKDYAYIKDYEGEADDAASEYEFMRDYDIGDIVEIITPYGMSSIVRVTEVVLSLSTSGYTLVPTLESLDKEDEQ